MIKIKSTGSALVDYVLPTTVVGLVVGMTIFSVYKEDLLTNFIAASTNSQVEDGVLAMNASTESVEALASEGGKNLSETPEAPDPAEALPPETEETFENNCVDGICTMSFNGVSLTGIPEDFSEFIETSGPASGTQAIAEILNQVADTLATDESTENDTLALLLDNIAGYSGKNIAFQSLETNCYNESSYGMSENQTFIEFAMMGEGNAITYQDELKDLKEGGDSNYSRFKRYYEQAIVELQSMPSSPQNEKIESMLNLLVNEIDTINNTFVDVIENKDFTLQEMKTHVASNSTDIRSQLIAILDE